jgi:hypothetical protein
MALSSNMFTAAATVVLLISRHFVAVSLAYMSPTRGTSVNLNKSTILLPTSVFVSSSSDGVSIGNTNKSNRNDGSAEEIAKQLRERAYNLRREAISAEQSLQNARNKRRDIENRETDEWIDILLGLSILAVQSESIDTNDNNTIVLEKISNNVTQTVKTQTQNNANNMSTVPTASTLALRLQENNFVSPSKLMRICERLHERETAMMLGPEGFLSRSNTDGGGFVLGDYDNNSLERKKEESEKITGMLDRLLEAVQCIDEERDVMNELGSQLRIRINDLRQNRDETIRRKVDNLVNNSASNNNKGMELTDLVRNSLDAAIDKKDEGRNDEDRQRRERIMKRMIETPLWLPPSIAPFAATSPVEISVNDWKMIKSDILKGSNFICTSWDEYSEVAAIYRGSITRASGNYDNDKKFVPAIEATFEDLLERVENHPNLSKKIQLFLVEDFEWRGLDMGNSMHYGSSDIGRRLAIEDGPDPVIIALAKEVVPEQESERSLSAKFLASFSTLATIFTTLAYAVSSFALNASFFNAVVKENDGSLFPLCLPVFFGVLAVSLVHEVGHVIAAKKHGVRLGLPVPLPSLQVGSFASITPFRSFPLSRTAMFDVAISGPGIAMLVSLAMIVFGLRLTLLAQTFTSFPVIPSAMMKSSLLVGSIASILFPKVMLAGLSQPIPIHPLFLIGIAGLYMSAVNLLPIGRLDGGRAAMSAFGRRSASLISLLSLLVLAFYSFNGLSGIIMFWGALIVVTQQRVADIPARNEVSGISGSRVALYNTLFILSILTLMPFPGGVSSM